MLISRADRGLIATWWFTADRLLLTCVLLLMAAGVLFSMAASPPVAARLGLGHFHFFERQLAFLAPAVVVLLATSLLNVTAARRLSLAVYAVGMGLMVAAIQFGPEIKGAHRWIDVGSVNLQPSEFVKPAFVVMAAWFLAEQVRRPDMPGWLFAWALFAAFVGLLLIQPDFGQTVLVCLVFAVLLLVHGISWPVVFGLGGLAGAAGFAAYGLFPHVASRINRFLDPEKGDTFQVDAATQAFGNGGLLGAGPGAGTAKRILPDAHTDFVAAVIGEEFGFVACAILIVLIAFIVLRVLRRALDEADPFAALAMTGLVSLFGFQSVINLAVNVSLMPAKGMTLPFISYGGSSLIAMAFSMGLVLVFARRKPRPAAVASHIGLATA